MLLVRNKVPPCLHPIPPSLPHPLTFSTPHPHPLSTATESFDIVLWASCFVLLSLLLNAPAIGPVMRLTGLSRIAPDRVRGRARAVAELQEFTAACIADLKQQQDGEFLQGERRPVCPPGRVMHLARHRMLRAFDLPHRDVS